MNFLAHLYLSGNNEAIMLGNFIADSLRKKQWYAYPQEVITGIKLHHSIDYFTDKHPIVEQSKARLRVSQHKYAPVVVDILYDHFLSANFQHYAQTSIETYAQQVYNILKTNYNALPKAMQDMLPFMVKHNWLVAYGTKEGLQNVFNGMSKRASFKNNMALAVTDLYKNYAAFMAEFNAFFPELKSHCQTYLTNNFTE